MVCTADDLLVWKDFPKGLRVLLLDEDVHSAAEIRSKLEEMDYAVSTFHSENEALSAISEGFHVAIVEVRAENEDGRFKFLKSAKDLPTIMISEVNLISTMMKCIALGAVEFLEKPVSEEKLRNIWQHVAHKAFAGLKDQSEAMKSVHNLERLDIKEESTQNQEQINEESLPDTPSTPQLKQAVRLVDNGDCQDQDQDQTSTHHNDIDSLVGETTTEKKNSSKSLDDSNPDLAKRNEASNSRGTKSSRRKMKVDWTCELHKKFVQAVEQLGVDQAIPSRILELMNVEGLTRHNVASHLQKYRLQRRHILPKESSRKWPQTRRNYYPQQKPIMAYPPYLSNHTFPPPAWPPPHAYAAPPHLYYPPCHPSETWLWNPFSRFQVQAEAWGCPQPSFPQMQNASHFQTRDSIHPNNSFDHSPGDEVIDKVVKEAINKPWLPLPLGLKPPSTESVISELSKQGISTVPPQINSCHRS